MKALDRLKALAANPAPLDDDEEEDGYRGSIISLYDDGTADLISDLDDRQTTYLLLRHFGRA